MQKLVSILLLFALMLQCCSELGVLAGYEIHKNYIARVLCVNRDKPAMHCDGKCYLKKKLQQDQQRKSSENGTTGNRIDVILFCSDGQLFLTPDLCTVPFVYSWINSQPYCSPYFSFFHPPRA